MRERNSVVNWSGLAVRKRGVQNVAVDRRRGCGVTDRVQGGVGRVAKLVGGVLDLKRVGGVGGGQMDSEIRRWILCQYELASLLGLPNTQRERFSHISKGIYAEQVGKHLERYCVVGGGETGCGGSVWERERGDVRGPKGWEYAVANSGYITLEFTTGISRRLYGGRTRVIHSPMNGIFMPALYSIDSALSGKICKQKRLALENTG
ncbi:hypothetical protein Tco_0296284 [Tanacetum coccineum]